MNGEKLWCTNVIKAGVLVVMAKTRAEDGERQGAQANHARSSSTSIRPGSRLPYRCHFMGLRALYNGIVKFTNVRVPRRT